MLERLIYQSRACWPTPESALDYILGVSVWKNAKLGVTGALGFTGGHYVQLLEGPPPSLDLLLASLQADPRHAELDILFRVETPRRLLPDWSMARIDLQRYGADTLRSLAHRDGLALTLLLANLVLAGATTTA